MLKSKNRILKRFEVLLRYINRNKIDFRKKLFND